MNPFLSSDRTAYRRWLNAVITWLIPGSAHFLSSRKLAGAIWFAAYAGFFAVSILFRDQLRDSTPFGILILTFKIAAIAHGCQQSIPRTGFRRDLAVGALMAWLPLMLGLRLFVMQPFYIPTGAMQPTLMGQKKDPDGSTARGDSVFMEKLSYRFHAPKRGDLVVFSTTGIVHSDVPKDQIYVKRLVGLPGERISIRASHLYVNGQKVTAPEIFNTIAAAKNGHTGYRNLGSLSTEQNEILVGPDEYLVFGDNSLNSLDSRYYGPIKRKSIIGRVFFRYAPSARAGFTE